MPKRSFAEALSRLAELAERNARTQFEIGDIANDQIEYVERRGPNGNGPKLQRMADAAGISPEALEQRRRVAHYVPLLTRVSNVSWSVYREIVTGAGGAGERERLIRLVAQPTDTERGAWTVARLRVEMGRSPVLHAQTEPLTTRIAYATPEDKREAAVALLNDPSVRRDINDLDTPVSKAFGDASLGRERSLQEWTREREAGAAAARARDPLTKPMDAAQALTDLEDAMERFVLKVADVFPRVTGMPDPARDPWARAVFMRQLVARVRGAADQIESLLNTGTPSGDIDNWVAEVLAAGKEKR